MLYVLFIVVTTNIRDRYEIMVFHTLCIKQPCSSICPKKRYKCIKVAETMTYGTDLTQRRTRE